MHLILTIMFGWKLCPKFNFNAAFPVMADFVAFLDHTKKNADVSQIDD